jgi:DNA processing protein
MKRFHISDGSFEKQMSLLITSDESEDIVDAFARATFSLITEPGDRFSGALIQALSPAEILEIEIKKVSSQALSARLREVGALNDIESTFGNIQIAHAEARQRWSSRLRLSEMAKALDVALRVKAKLLTCESADWPQSLDDLGLAKPHCLWLRSRHGAESFKSPALSLVGSRVSSSYGDWVTSEIVADASNRNLAIVSGGAYGIDAIAHRAAIAHQQSTVAFMAGGIDRMYPSGNTALLDRVIEFGAVVAEQAPGASPTKWRFLQRNRLIAALGQATVVVEAGLRSGALNTISHAIELGRPVGAVPGPITSQTSAGCNRLLSQGLASAICQPTDAADLALGRQGWFQPELESLGAFETRALDALGRQALSAQQIGAKAGLTTKETAIALGQLSLLGFVEQRDSGWVKLPLEREQRPDSIG